MKLKGSVYTIGVRSAKLYCADTWTTAKGQEVRLEVNEILMLKMDVRSDTEG